MNILIISAQHPYKAAGIVVADLYRIFKKNGHNTKLLVKTNGLFFDKDIIYLEKYFNFTLTRIQNRIKKIFQRKTKAISNFDYYFHDLDLTKQYFKTEDILRKINFNPDFILYSFPHKFLNAKNLYELNKETGAPILLYMMDMSPITGGCHYAWDCKNYMESCGCCPGLFSLISNDQSKINFEFKKQYIDKTNIIPIAVTEWQYRQLIQSQLFKNKKKYKILLPIDETIFKPDDKTKIRKFLGLPIEKKIIFIGAVSFNEKRKGWKELTESFKILAANLSDKKKSSVHIAIAGRIDKNATAQLPFAYTALGILDHNDLPKAFQAADLFVCPSIEDSGPMMINQSVLCGTPVVSFEMGVALDIVMTGQTGYRAKLKESTDLANGINTILNLDDQEYKKMSENCRKMGLEFCNPKKQTEKLIEIYLINCKNKLEQRKDNLQ